MASTRKTKAELVEELERKQDLIDHLDNKVIFMQDEMSFQREAYRNRNRKLTDSVNAHRVVIACLAVLLLFAVVL